MPSRDNDNIPAWSGLIAGLLVFALLFFSFDWPWWMCLIAGFIGYSVVALVIGNIRTKHNAGDDLRIIIHEGQQRRQQMEAARQQHRDFNPTLKPYVTQLCAVHARNGSFSAADTSRLGQEIYNKYGHQGMIDVCDNVRAVLGVGPARDLEYKWSGIGEWLG